MQTRILFSYPLLAVARRIRRVDSRYAYLVVRDGYVPLRRREGCFSTIWRYEKYGEDKYNSGSFYYFVLSDHNEVSSFFQTRVQEEYADNYEGFEELGVLWDKRFDELYGVRKIVKQKRKYVELETLTEFLERKQREIKPPKYIDPCSIVVTYGKTPPETTKVRYIQEDERERKWREYWGLDSFHDDGQNEPMDTFDY
jgi:hypothetical protein